MKRLDTHALTCLDALVTECHVTRAAHRVGIGQPAMSEMLGRLREVFGDPLLVRTHGGMAPTPRAIEALQKTRSALRLIDDAVNGSDHPEGQTMAVPVRIVVATSLAFTLLPKLISQLQHQSPRREFSIHPGDPRLARDLLEANECDLVIGYPPTVSGSLHVSPLYKYRLVSVVRNGHPTIRDSLSLEQFVTFPHVTLGAGALTVSTIETAVERALRRRRVTRLVAVRAPDLLISAAIVSETDFIATLPEPTALRFRPMLGLSLLDPPILLPEPRILMIWHERSHHDPHMRDLRRMVRRLAKEA